MSMPLNTEPRLARPTRLEWALASMILALVALALLGPAMADHPHQHGFADQRMLWGLPCALDVLSNLPFAMAGVWGLVALARQRCWEPAVRACAVLFFAGLVLTAAGSSWYHWQPDDAGLLWDRLGMAVAFAGMLGLATATRLSGRAGVALAAAALVLAPLAATNWAATGNLWPWVVVQMGGMLLLAALAGLPALPGAPVVRLAAVLGCYAVAKLLESQDHAIFSATQGLLGGHALKHLMAAAAVLPVLAALRRPPATASMQNGAPGAAWARTQRQSA